MGKSLGDLKGIDMPEAQILQYALGMGQAQRQAGMRLGRDSESRSLLFMLKVPLKVSISKERSMIRLGF